MKTLEVWQIYWRYFYMFFVLSILQVSSSLRLTLLKVPASRPAGYDVRLHCNIDPEGDAVYTIRWFHNGREFFRFSPGEDPSIMFFPAPGLNLDVHASSNTSVVLRDVDVDSAGLFRCEVVADAPHFHTVAAEAFMLVGEFYNVALSDSSQDALILAALLFVMFYCLK